jgi:hypothetical protein
MPRSNVMTLTIIGVLEHWEERLGAKKTRMSVEIQCLMKRARHDTKSLLVLVIASLCHGGERMISLRRSQSRRASEMSTLALDGCTSGILPL